MFKTLINAFKNPEVRKKILITIGLLILFRIGCWLPVPGIDYAAVQLNMEQEGAVSLLSLLSAVTGSALANGAFLAIGISPYINSSIIVQLLTVAIPKLEEWSKQGDDGRKKINTVTRFVTLALAIIQAIGIVINWASADALDTKLFGDTFLAQEWVLGTVVAVVMVAGSMFTMWLGDRITEKGVGNGISLLIYVGILATTGLSIIAVVEQIIAGGETGQQAIWELLGFLVMAILIFGFIVFVDLAERKIPIQYAKQIKGRKQYGGQSTFIPLKVNASGVMPIIFATAIITFPQLLCQMFWKGSPFELFWTEWFGVGKWPYAILVSLLILGFSYFYANMQFNPEDVARNIQQYGGFIPGIRPGAPTLDYLKKVTKRITLFGAIYLMFIALVPSLLLSIFSLGNQTLVSAMTSTGMLIIVSVALEFDKQLQSLMMMKHYKGFLK